MRRDLRSLRRKSVQEAFRGVLACQGPGNPSLPGKAQGFRGQDSVEGHGGFDVVMEKVVQWEQENPASNGREMIDDFRLAGSRTWRRMGEYSTETRLFMWMVHALDNNNASPSEGGALAVVVEEFPEALHQTRHNTDFPRLMQPSEARAVPRLSLSGRKSSTAERWISRPVRSPALDSRNGKLTENIDSKSRLACGQINKSHQWDVVWDARSQRRFLA